MKYMANDDDFTGFVTVRDGMEARTIDLSDTVVASLDDHDRFIGLDIMDTRPFGVPFDDAAARSALAWAADRMEIGTTTGDHT